MIWMEFPIAANCRAHLRPRPLARSGIAGWKSKLWSAWLCLWDFATFSFHCQFNKIVIFCKSTAATSIELWYYGSKILFNRQKCTPPPCKRPQQYTFPFFYSDIFAIYCYLYICLSHKYLPFVTFHLSGWMLWQKYTGLALSLFWFSALVSSVSKILSKTILFWIIGGLSVNIFTIQKRNKKKTHPANKVNAFERKLIWKHLFI